MSGGDIASGGTVLGFDVGTRRIGVAVGSSFGHGARALVVIDVHDGAPEWPGIDRLREEWRPDMLVVGDPMTLDDGDQPNRKRAQRFARQVGIMPLLLQNVYLFFLFIIICNTVLFY